jgi:hypothetical protein
LRATNKTEATVLIFLHKASQILIHDIEEDKEHDDDDDDDDNDGRITNDIHLPYTLVPIYCDTLDKPQS